MAAAIMLYIDGTMEDGTEEGQHYGQEVGLTPMRFRDGRNLREMARPPHGKYEDSDRHKTLT